MRRLVLLFLAAGIPSSAQNPLPLTLAGAEKTAVQNNPALSSARLTASAAGQVPYELRANLLPNVTGQVTGVGADSGSRLAAGGLNNPTVYNRFGTGLQVSQLVTDFGRTSNLVSSARLRAAAQEQFTGVVQASVLAGTAQAYFAVLRAQALLKVAEETVSTRQLLSDQVSQLAAAGLKSQLDVSFANVNLADARIRLSDARNSVESAISQLATVLGLPGRQSFALSEEPMPPAPPDRIDPLIQEAIQKRPELAELRLQADAAQKYLQAEKDLIYPTVAVLGSAGFAPAADPQVPGRYGALGANISIPLLNGGLFKARRTEAEYHLQAANKDVQDQENRILRDVRVAYLNARNAYERLGLSAQLLDQAKLALDLAQRRYDLGLGSIVELSQAQLNLTGAQIASASARYDYQTQNILLQYQAGALR